jgi:hypothetical protein
MAFHDQLIFRAVIGAPGWFMWPDVFLPYPLGFGEPDLPEIGRERFDRFCRQKMRLLVGEKDRDQGTLRKKFKQTDLSAFQGKGRKERATKWFQALEKTALNENLELNVSMRIVKNTAHRVNRHFTKAAISFLSGSDE